ncbi:hypothetical protein Tco_0308543 [Tanacetum coccineum]
MEMESDIDNMTLNEYLEYEAVKERRLWDNVRSKSSPTRYEMTDFNSSHRDKSISLDFQHYYEDAFIDKYYALPPLLPCFRPSQPHNERGYESPNMNDKFFAQPPNTPNTPNTLVDKNDSDFDEILEVKELKTLYEWGKRKFSIGDVDLEKEEAEVEDDDDGDTYDIWDITVEDVERIRQFLTPNVPDEMDEEADFNPTKDIEELERLLAKDPQSHFTEIQVWSQIIISLPRSYSKGVEFEVSLPYNCVVKLLPIAAIMK